MRIPFRSSPGAKVELLDEAARYHGNPLTPLLLGFLGTLLVQKPRGCSVCGRRALGGSSYRPPTGLVLRAAEVHPCQALWGSPPQLPQPAALELLL